MTSRRQVYTVTTTPSALGARAAVSWHSDSDIIGLSGPAFWRPTMRWAQRRADRHVARRLRKHARAARAESYEVTS